MKEKMSFVMLFSTMLALLMAGCSGSSLPQTPTPAPTPITLPSGLVIEPEAIGRLDALLAQMTQDGTFSGSVLIAVDGKILLSKGYGLADRLQGISNTPQTRFHLGSMTKAFTAMGILILQSQGKLSVQDPICNYIAGCPVEWQDITIHQLLIHTSGLSSQLSDQLYREIENGPNGPLTPAEQAHYLGLDSQWSLDSPPGEQYAYNNLGYVLLAHIIEEMSGQSYADYLDQAIFTPLNMYDTGYPDGSLSEEVVYYPDGLARTGVKCRRYPYPVPEGSGGMYSSLEDLLLWDQALYTDQLLPQSELDRMFEPYVPMIDSPIAAIGYGLGMGEYQGQPFVEGAGGGEGSPFGTLIIRFPQDRLTVIILANQYIDQVYFWGLISDELFGKN
jgi:CubicO group peptidase (beta-lactamase class C family)